MIHDPRLNYLMPGNGATNDGDPQDVVWWDSRWAGDCPSGSLRPERLMPIENDVDLVSARLLAIDCEID
jgi:hypothetical protein